MQLHFPKKMLRYLKPVIHEVRNTEVAQELRIPEGMPDIGRVLTAWGQIMLRSKQWRSEQIELSGGVKMWVLYAPEDGTEPRMVQSWLPFQLRWDVPEAGKEGPVRMMPLLRYADSRSLSSRKLMIRAGIGVLAQGFCSGESELYAPETVPEDVQILKSTYPVRLNLEAGEKTFLIDEDLKLDGPEGKDSKLISCTVNPEVTEQQVLSDKIVLKGCGNLKLVFRSDDGRICGRNFDLPFSQLSDLEGTYSPDAGADVCVAVTDLDADLAENGQLRIKCGMVAQYLVDDRQTIELAEDGYSPRRTLDFDLTELELPVLLEDRTEVLKAEQTVNTSGGTVADLRFYPDHPRVRRSDGEAELEMAGTFQVLYYGDDASLQAATARWEGCCHLPADGACRILPMAGISGQVQSAAGVDGMKFNSTQQLKLRIQAGRGIPMMTGMELGELQQPDPQRPSLILRRCDGDSLWQIAKETGSSVAAIEAVNALQDRLPAEQMILIPIS